MRFYIKIRLRVRLCHATCNSNQCWQVGVKLLARSPCLLCGVVLFAYAGFLHSILHLLADVLRNGVDVHHIVHCVCNDEVL